MAKFTQSPHLSTHLHEGAEYWNGSLDVAHSISTRRKNTQFLSESAGVQIQGVSWTSKAGSGPALPRRFGVGGEQTGPSS